ncbi:hypothetical protein [Geobacter sulfurreducens]|uniref:hypothetical protein n=1 Tax=Geobacter sulfurreducens TaxID=35554 RepID=UPI00142E40D5|nr:hypothetical protein [Geobacter sulfurreducens]
MTIIDSSVNSDQLDILRDFGYSLPNWRIQPPVTVPGGFMGRYIREERTAKEKIQDTVNTIIAFFLMIVASALVVLLVFLFYENSKG